MDANLTYCPSILNASINATLMQPPRPLWTDLISPAAILIGIFIGRYLTILGAKIQRGYELENRRLQVYSELRGHYTLQSNLYYSFGRAYIDAQVGLSSLINHLRETPSSRGDLLDFQQYNQYHEPHELGNKLHLELARSSKDLEETIGQIEMLFPRTDDLIAKILKVEGLQFRSNALTKPPDDIKGINKWKDAREIELSHFLDNDVAPAFDSLLDYLKTKLDEEARAKRRWQFWRG